MRFALSEEQAALAAMVRDLLRRRSGSADVRSAVDRPSGYDETLWSVLCEQIGVAALAIPEEYGGAGYTLVETQVVLEELGAALTPSPMLGSAVLAAQALLLAGDDATCREVLPGLASGRTVAALVWAGPDGHWPTDGLAVTASPDDDDRWVLDGTGAFVLDGDHADVLLVLAQSPSGPGLFRLDPRQESVRRTAETTMDPTLRLATVELTGAEARAVSTRASFLPTLRDVALSAVSALQVGAAQRCLDMTVAYSRERVQFGRPIGSFQALKHRMADMLVDVETARSASWAAGWSASRREDGLVARAATAKAWCSEALGRVAAETVQLHGGIAITWEHDAHLYFKRAHALSQLFGQPHEHRARLERMWDLA